MNILWLCNTMLPQIAESLDLPKENVGGWLNGLSAALQARSDVHLTVCFPQGIQQSALCGTLENLDYYGFHQSGEDVLHYRPALTEAFVSLLQKTKPDVIHIFGTEFPNKSNMVDAAAQLGMEKRIAVHIQGLISVCARHYAADLPNSVIHSFTVRDFLRQDNIAQQIKKYERRGVFELSLLQKVSHILGRTDWDKALTSQLAPKATYHFCGETLRGSFYQNAWNEVSCEKHSIFSVQNGTPIKGFHYLIEALPLILAKYPDAHLFVTGNDPLAKNAFVDRLRQSSYSRYIAKLLQRYGVNDHITYLGYIDEAALCSRMLASNVFVSASSIENSPNTVGEAMLLGVPVVSSDVGGVKSMLTHDQDGLLYQHNAPYMLADSVCRIFSDAALCQRVSHNAQQHAAITHDRENNLSTVLSIYHSISEEAQ